MEKLQKILESNQNIFIDTKIEIGNKVFKILQGQKILIDLKNIKTEREFLKKLYEKLVKEEKINKIFLEYDLNENNFELFYLLDIEDELDIGGLKIIFNNIEKALKEIQEIINYLVSYRERRIIFYMIGNLQDYYYTTGIENINIREGDDFLKIDL